MYLSDIPLPEGVALPELAQEEDGQAQPVVSIHVIKEVVIEEEEEVAEGEVPVAGEEPAEGAEPAAEDDAESGDDDA